MSALEAEPMLPIPFVTDANIVAAEEYLGVVFDEPRRQILRSNDSFDVQACPGSGKTTLLVAKLAALASKWPHSTRGVCVLSHTNVAREEIETKLGRTPIGQRLLRYPHFVGTIHGFVNEFLALPLLRSEGHQVRLIDDEAHGEYCRDRLYSGGVYVTARSFLANKEKYNPDSTIRALRYEGCELSLGSAAGRFPCSAESESGKQLAEIKGEAASRGLWRFDDMFAWADRLLTRHPSVAEFARWRFPAVFLDETQDTSELQGSLLDRVFPARACGLRQRFGDSNQAIYDLGEAAATTDAFPAAGYRSVPNSKRFGPGIAGKVHRLAPVPLSPALTGEGPRGNVLPVVPGSADMPHTIFLFALDSTHRVLPAFGGLLLDAFPDEALRSAAFRARAIGRVGKPDATGANIPKHLGDYWNAYRPRAARLDSRPQRLAEYVHLAQCRRVASVDCSEPIKIATKGISELISITRPSIVRPRGQAVRWLSEALRMDPPSVVALNRLLWVWCIETVPIVEQSWMAAVAELRRALNPIIGSEWNDVAEDFCRWSAEYARRPASAHGEGDVESNRYRFDRNGRHVDIEVGTIHSAKGQTHTATLVLETYFKRHDLGDVLPWICGEKCGAGHHEGKERTERMRLIYTATTRPSHLLCLAMREDAIRRDGPESDTRRRLEQLGWTVQVLDCLEGSA